VGRAIALELSRYDYDILVHYRRSASEAEEVARLLRENRVEAETFGADLSDASAVSAMFGFLRDRFGRLDVLVNSAAVFRRTPIDQMDAEAFDFHVSTNLRGPYLCSIEAERLMRRTGGGSIVNITDVAAQRPFRSHVPYCVSKAGLEMLTRGLAKAFAPLVRVNAVGPGTVLFRPDESEEDRQRVIARIPMGRIGTPEDIASTVSFLCTEAHHITGQVILVDGGRSLD
jgi:pteridine reductase